MLANTHKEMPATSVTIYRDIAELEGVLARFRLQVAASTPQRRSGICGFDGFIDTFIRLKTPSTMAEFGPKVTAAAGISASYPVRFGGDKFGGNGPLFASALNDIHAGEIDIVYCGALGDGQVLPIYRRALEDKTQHLYTLAAPAQSTCLEFDDGKIMLGDLTTCEEITWERLVTVVGQSTLDGYLRTASFISAVNWGKLPHAGTIWSNLAVRLAELDVPTKSVHYFMDLAEFESRERSECEDLLARLPAITRQCTTMLSFNLKEAWQMGEVLGWNYQGKRKAEEVVELCGLLRSRIAVDRVIVHPNDGAVCASMDGAVYMAGPYCSAPFISTGAGDNFGAGCLAAALRGLDDTGIILAGNSASGHFVRSGRTPTFAAMLDFLRTWSTGGLGDRL